MSSASGGGGGGGGGADVEGGGNFSKMYERAKKWFKIMPLCLVKGQNLSMAEILMIKLIRKWRKRRWRWRWSRRIFLSKI